jgi:hypothetical protein
MSTLTRVFGCVIDFRLALIPTTRLLMCATECATFINELANNQVPGSSLTQPMDGCVVGWGCLLQQQ